MLFVVLALLDLGFAAVQDNTLAKASRNIAREAIMRSRFSPAAVTIWGPNTYTGDLSDIEIAPMVADVPLPLMTPDQVDAVVQWLDGDNAPGDRVRVTLTFEHAPLTGPLMPWGALTLRSETTMCITH